VFEPFFKEAVVKSLVKVKVGEQNGQSIYKLGEIVGEW
jgi:hypothetical protein